MSNPKVSVIIPVFNKERFIGRCLRSIFAQTLSEEDYEVILIDDGSSDNSLKALQPFLHSLVLIEHEKNLGLPAALNSGIRAARGQFVVRMDADDYVHEEYLNILSLYLRLNNEIDAVACDYTLVDQRQNQMTHMDCLKDPIGCAIMYRIEQLIDLGLYDERFIVREDEDMSRRFSEKYALTRIPIPLYKYYIHGENLTSNAELMDEYKHLIEEKHSG